ILAPLPGYHVLLSGTQKLKPTDMKKSIKKGVLYFLIGFAVFFLFRLGYGFTSNPEGEEQEYYYDYNYNAYVQDDYSSFEFSRKNYASSKYEYKSNSGGMEQVTTADQKYEKVATVNSSTGEFNEDEKKIREEIEKHGSIIQFEQNSGLSGSRYLNLAIGVPPEFFDEMVEVFRNIGSLKSIYISKTDKTNEYKELQAKRISLEKNRESLYALKNHGGSIEELIELENQILGIEQQIQDLGVSLGDYDDENEFCTIKFTLSESIIKTIQISFMHRVKVALEWTVKYYGITILIFFLLSMGVWVITLIFKAINTSPEKKEENGKQK
ncbi:MAG: DUF4349 domain-containing protein, partial [Bacteroidota bacterium]